MGLASNLKQQALGFSQKFVERVFADERRAQRVVEVLGRAQQAKKSIDSTHRMLMHQLNFTTRQDFRDLGRQLSGLKKRLRSIDDKLGKS